MTREILSDFEYILEVSGDILLLFWPLIDYFSWFSEYPTKKLYSILAKKASGIQSITAPNKLSKSNLMELVAAVCGHSIMKKLE